jgi:hypothetical protein
VINLYTINANKLVDNASGNKMSKEQFEISVSQPDRSCSQGKEKLQPIIRLLPPEKNNSNVAAKKF